METAKGSCLLDWAEAVVGRTITIASCWCVSRRVLGHWRFWLLLLLLPLPLLSGSRGLRRGFSLRPSHRNGRR
jgi:hypothetical protein